MGGTVILTYDCRISVLQYMNKPLGVVRGSLIMIFSTSYLELTGSALTTSDGRVTLGRFSRMIIFESGIKS